jgi:hypothetical protein
MTLLGFNCNTQMVVMGDNCGHYGIDFYFCVFIWKMILFIKYYACTRCVNIVYLCQTMGLYHFMNINKM